MSAMEGKDVDSREAAIEKIREYKYDLHNEGSYERVFEGVDRDTIVAVLKEGLAGDDVEFFNDSTNVLEDAPWNPRTGEFLIEGFENRATIATYYNFDWMPKMVEKQGYRKDVDYFVYRLAIPREIPEFYRRIYERAQRKGNFEIIEFRKKKELKPWIKPILHLMNECYSESDIYGYTPLDEKEMEALAKKYMPVVDPRFVKAVKKGEELVAFIVGMPDLTEGIQKARGRLLPFGFIKILRAAKRTKQLDLLLGAIKERYRGLGVDVLLGMKMILSAHEAGLEEIDSHHELETNVKVRAEMEKMGGKIYKRFRVYKKEL